MKQEKTKNTLSKTEILEVYRIATLSRECSLLGRKEVLTGKAKFGIFGDGKELPQIAMAKCFKNGDFRSGYYRDQTFMMAIGKLSVEQFFAGLYGDTDIEREPMSAGRQMGGHFVTKSLNPDGSWKNLMNQKNSSSDLSPTAAQMPRLVGLAQASKIYRSIKDIPNSDNFSNNGNEIAWGTIGNASTSEGMFFEAINAAGVLQIPMVLSVWDDDYGISVHAKHQTTKGDISEILKGFQKEKNTNGCEIFKVKGWDYEELLSTYKKAEEIARIEHIPVIVHVAELTQPQGHSTSGSHERYKGEERLAWEAEFDCNTQLRNTIISEGIATAAEIENMENEIKQQVLDGKNRAWDACITPVINEKENLLSVLESILPHSQEKEKLQRLIVELKETKSPIYRNIMSTARKALRTMPTGGHKVRLAKWTKDFNNIIAYKYNSKLYSESEQNVFSAKKILPIYNEKEHKTADGRIIIRDNFDALLEKHKNLLIFGEDVGFIGDVNQGLEGLQKKYGAIRVADTGIREASIIGQGIGMALRGLRPIAEIQYLDYMLYALQTLSDDLASLQYRTFGSQKAPLIIRTRGHRLEGIWHSGSPMGMLVSALRGIIILVPRNMTQAAGFYNALLECDEPALVIESLNGYRLKEPVPTNYADFKTPIGVVEKMREGTDITLVSYGSTLRLVENAARELQEVGINCEIIDVQSLIPFDINHDIAKSLAKTNRLLVIDEDVPGGASAYILQQIIEKQGAYRFLDSAPQTLTAKEHRTAYGSDGDYFSKPSIDDIYEKVCAIMHEACPKKHHN